MLSRLKAFLNLGFYTSELDQFLDAYNRAHPKLSKSQQAEKNKYDRIFKLRDEAITPTLLTPFWNKF